MARKEKKKKKISVLAEKITKKQDEIKSLKAKLNELKDKKAKDDYQELTNYMLANNLTAEEVLACIKE